MPNRVTNIVIAGLGGQGVLTTSDILAEAGGGGKGDGGEKVPSTNGTAACGVRT
jgi:Pyruvate/2-oxoacid:ferredoxin oxidoreductase gamma subunit